LCVFNSLLFFGIALTCTTNSIVQCNNLDHYFLMHSPIYLYMYRLFGENSVSGNISSETLTWVKSAVDVLMGKST